MTPLTGVAGLYGPQIRRAAMLACREINADGGVAGRRLQLLIEDDGSLPHVAAAAARRLVEERGCAALVGSLMSGSLNEVLRVVEQRLRVPLLNYGFCDSALSSRFLFNFAGSADQQIEPLMRYMVQRFGPRVFVVGNQDDWPRRSVRAAQRALASCGGSLVGEEYFEFGINRQAMDSLLDRVVDAEADVLLPCLIGRDQCALLSRFVARGLQARIQIASNHLDETVLAQLPASSRADFYSCASYFGSVDTAANHDFLRQLSEPAALAGPPAQAGSQFAEAVYLCVRALAAAINAAQSSDQERLTAALREVVVNAPQGRVQIDAERQHALVHSFLARSTALGEFEILQCLGAATSALTPPASPPPASALTPIRPHASVPAASAERVLAAVDSAIIACDGEGRISAVNHAAAALFDYPLEDLRGMSVQQLLPPNLRAALWQGLLDFTSAQPPDTAPAPRRELSVWRRDGSLLPLEVGITRFIHDESLIIVLSLRDVSERKRAEDELLWRASHDALTGLPNRGLIRERLVAALQRSQRHGRSLALLFIDLDSFKAINDSYGHEIGDLLLKEVAQRLIDQVRPGDTVGRMSGDEFVILCEQLDDATTASALAERVNATLRQQFRFNEFSVYVSASVGIALGQGQSHNADDLLRSADAAMYAAKARGSDSWQFFNQSLYEKARQRIAITQGLRWAIERDEFSIRLQPIVETKTGRIVAAEVLLRWHPPQGETSPAVFIPVAEMTGAIVPVGAWVFRAACEAEVAWRQRWGIQAPHYLAVNVSARQLTNDHLDCDFKRILQQTGADPSRILLEITESSLMADVETNLRVLQRLVELGLQVAVDDFGTGYSSLAQLNRLPVSVLKIDRAFVDGVDQRSENRTVFRAIIGLGRALGLTLVAEGVETQSQLAEVARQGCDLVQGYLFHRPLTADDFSTLFDTQRAGLPRSVSTLPD